MEKLARKLASNIAGSLNYDNEKEAVIAYGLIAIIQIIITILLVLLLGFLVGAPVETLIICFAVSILRKYSGGAHAGSAELCTGIAVVYCTVAAFISKKLFLTIYSPIFMLIAIIIIYVISFLIIRKYAPVDSPNKPIRTEEKRKKMRKGSFVTLLAYFTLSAILFVSGYEVKFLNSYGISLLFGIVWQVFSLTSSGASLLHSVNNLFERR